MWFFTSEQKMLFESVASFAQKHLAPSIEQHDDAESFNHLAFKALGDLGLLGVTVAETDGGAGMGAVEATLVMEALSTVDPATCLSYLAHAILCVNQIAVNGNAEQKKKYLPKLISGEWIGGMGMSEPGAGSDALSMTTKAEKNVGGRIQNHRHQNLDYQWPGRRNFLCVRENRRG